MRLCRLTTTFTALLCAANGAWAQDAIWIDVASQQDYALEHVVEAVHIPYTHIARRVSAQFPDKSTPIKLYARHELQALQAQEALQTLGYEQVLNRGELAALKEEGQATVQSTVLSEREGADQNESAYLNALSQQRHPTINAEIDM